MRERAEYMESRVMTEELLQILGLYDLQNEEKCLCEMGCLGSRTLSS